MFFNSFSTFGGVKCGCDKNSDKNVDATFDETIQTLFKISFE